MGIKIIGLDLDGTTLGTNGCLPDLNKVAIERAIACGVNVVIATGRVISAVPDAIMNIRGLRDTLSLQTGHMCVICSWTMMCIQATLILK